MRIATKCLTALGILLLAAPVFAQGSLTGTVRDTSGAVLPGVTVEAASHALIEKTRSAIDRRHGPVPNRRPAPRHVLGDVQRCRASTP